VFLLFNEARLFAFSGFVFVFHSQISRPRFRYSLFQIKISLFYDKADFSLGLMFLMELSYYFLCSRWSKKQQHNGCAIPPHTPSTPINPTPVATNLPFPYHHPLLSLSSNQNHHALSSHFSLHTHPSFNPLSTSFSISPSPFNFGFNEDRFEKIRVT
jgi:hypothetical protein